MSDINPSNLDIFEPTHEGTFNACVGTNSLHNMRTYAEGYLQAAQKLLEVMFSQKLMYERDTLVHPILYSARHSIELSIKHILIQLNQTDIKTEVPSINGHNLKDLWLLFKAKTNFDRRIIELVNAIDPIVTQLDQADPDAQDFRYPVNSDGTQTLDGKTIIDLITVGQVVDFISAKLIQLFNLVEVIVDERKLNSFTKEFNREELRQLSIELPDVTTWKDNPEFEAVKARWKERYNISNKTFSSAINFIKDHMEFSGNINFEHPFIALDDKLLEDLVKKANEIRYEQIADRKLSFREQLRKPNQAHTSYPLFKPSLSPKIMAELKALFYISRDNELSDTFNTMFELFGKEFDNLTNEKLEQALKRSFIHLYEKTSFINEVIGGLRKTGRIKLANELKKYIIKEEFGIRTVNLGQVIGQNE